MTYPTQHLIRRITLACGLAAVTCLTCACSADAGPDDHTKGILISFEAATDSDGNCTPKRVEYAYVGTTQLHAIRGDADYELPTGTDAIPFQAVFKYPNEQGIARSRATTMLNHPGTCADLTITVDIEYCEYFGDNGREKRACPEIRLEGINGFKSVQFTRSDQT